MKIVNKLWCFYDQKWLFSHTFKKQQLILRWHITTCIFKWESFFEVVSLKSGLLKLSLRPTEYACIHSASIHSWTMNLSTHRGYSGNTWSLHPSNKERPSATGIRFGRMLWKALSRDSPWLRIMRLAFVWLTNWFADSSRDTQLTWQPPWVSPWTSSFVCVFLIWCMCLVGGRHSMLSE